MSKRIISLLPAATEICCALGARADLVGVSHECDYPPGVIGLPVLTHSRVGPLPASRSIGQSIGRLLQEGLAIYEVDVEGLASLQPDVILTQDLCSVCAVSLDQVCAAAREALGPEVVIVSLHPEHLEDIVADVRRIAAVLDRQDAGDVLVHSLAQRMAHIQARADCVRSRPRVLTIEWLDPVMLGGLWMPELIELCGGTAEGAGAGERAPTLDWTALCALSPDVVVIKPCGFPLARTVEEISVLPKVLPLNRWPAGHNGQVYLADGNAYFNRPGPRIVDSLEILAACVHPEMFHEYRLAYPDAVLRVSKDLQPHRWAG